MNPTGQPTAVPPPPDTIPALMRGLCEQIEHDLSELAWLLSTQPNLLSADSIKTLLQLPSIIHEIDKQLRDC